MRYLSFFLALLIAFPCSAGTGNEVNTPTGPKVTEQADAVSAAAWSNNANVPAVDAATDDVTLKVGWRSNSLDFTNYTLPIVKATYQTFLTGFKIHVWIACTNNAGDVVLHAQMISGVGVPIGTAKTAALTSTSIVEIVFGDETDQWGQSTYLTMASIDKNFGFRLWTDNAGAASGVAQLDGYTTEIFYYRRHTLSSMGAGL